jgi:hypothetical protein
MRHSHTRVRWAMLFLALCAGIFVGWRGRMHGSACAAPLLGLLVALLCGYTLRRGAFVVALAFNLSWALTVIVLASLEGLAQVPYDMWTQENMLANVIIVLLAIFASGAAFLPKLCGFTDDKTKGIDGGPVDDGEENEAEDEIL